MADLNKIHKSFLYAFAGLRAAAKEATFKIMLFFAVSVVFLAVYFPLEGWEKITLFFLVGMVLTAELLNSQIERILDIVQPENDPRVKEIKDISAAAVFIISLTSAIIGLIIFIPHILILLKSLT